MTDNRTSHKAHTPTDDEREAIIDALLDELGWEWDEVPEEHIPSSRSILGDMADRVLAVVAGFRRSEVPEPSADAWLAGERSVADAAHYEANPEPQTEPTDAEVEAARFAYDGSPGVHADRIRAALRAAAEAGGER